MTTTASQMPHLWDEGDSMGDAINPGIELVLIAIAWLRQLPAPAQ